MEPPSVLCTTIPLDMLVYLAKKKRTQFVEGTARPFAPPSYYITSVIVHNTQNTPGSCSPPFLLYPPTTQRQP